MVRRRCRAAAERQLPLLSVPSLSLSLLFSLLLLGSSGALLCTAGGEEETPVTLSAAAPATGAAAAGDFAGAAGGAPRLGSLFGWAIRHSDPSRLAAKGAEASSLSGGDAVERLARLKERAAELEGALSSAAGGAGAGGGGPLGLAAALARAGDPSLPPGDRAGAWEGVAEL